MVQPYNANKRSAYNDQIVHKFNKLSKIARCKQIKYVADANHFLNIGRTKILSGERSQNSIMLIDGETIQNDIILQSDIIVTVMSTFSFFFNRLRRPRLILLQRVPATRQTFSSDP